MATSRGSALVTVRAANDARSHTEPRAGLYAIAHTGPTQPTREARARLPIVERCHFVSPVRHRAPCSFSLRIWKLGVKRIGAQTEVRGTFSATNVGILPRPFAPMPGVGGVGAAVAWRAPQASGYSVAALFFASSAAVEPPAVLPSQVIRPPVRTRSTPGLLGRKARIPGAGGLGAGGFAAQAPQSPG